jgi:hypothetical protein
VHPAFRIVVLVALVLFGVAACAATSNGQKSSWRFVSFHGSQQSGKNRR